MTKIKRNITRQLVGGECAVYIYTTNEFFYDIIEVFQQNIRMIYVYIQGLIFICYRV